MNRRDLLTLPIAASMAAVTARGATKKPLGFQLYSVRTALGEKAPVTLKRLAEAGYKKVETLRPTHAQILPLCKDFGIAAVAGHYELNIATGKPGPGMPAGYNWTQAAEEAARAGLKFMVIPYVAPPDRGNADVYKRLAESLNKAGEITRKAGMTLAYHHHAFEFGPAAGGTERPIDILLAVPAENLTIEMDVFWVAIAGEDPAAMLKKWKGRVKLLHLKDRAPGAPKQFAENLSPAAFREVGYGNLDFKGILKAAAEAGVEHYFVEQDQVAGDPVEALTASIRSLEKLGF